MNRIIGDDDIVQQIINGACIAGAIAYSVLILSALFNYRIHYLE